MIPIAAHGNGESAKAVCLRVAGLSISVRSGPSGPALTVDGPSRKFLAGDGRDPDVALEAAWGDLSEDHPGPLLFDSGGAWKLHEEQDGRLGFRFFSSNHGPSPYLLMTLAPDVRSGSLTLHRPSFPPHAALEPLQYPADEVLMVHLLGQGLGAEIHACGVVDGDGRGYLLAGQSGDGKTTMARLWEGRQGIRILSDDRIVIRREGDRFVMHGTPWHGEAELAESLEAPLDAIFFLERGAANQVIPVGVPEAAAQLLARCFVPFHDAPSVGRTIAFLGEVATGVSCARLAFVPGKNVCDFVAGSVRIPPMTGPGRTSTESPYAG